MRPGIRLLLAVVVAVGFFGWRYVKHDESAAAAPVVATAGAPVKPRTWKLGSLTLKPCELGQPHSGVSTAAWCAPFDVPENRADPSGRHITLNLAIVRSSAQVTASDMVVFLAGGPGQAATETYPAVAPAMQPLLAHRHVLLIDQRGTGHSNPLSCKSDTDVVTTEDATSFDIEQLRKETVRCLADVKTKADPRFYTTTDAVQDLEDARKALGSPQYDLIGVSYGTRVAQQFVKRHPDAVRSVVLDGVAPDSLILGEDFAVNLDAALKAQFARCDADAACKARFSDPYQTLYQLRDALRANPHKVSFRDPQSYKSVQRVLSEYSLATVVRMFAYSPETAALLPLSIDAAAHGDVGPLLGQAKLLNGDLGDSMDGGMQYSVICSEDADLLTSRPQDVDTILGDKTIEAFKAACAIWPHGERPADFHAPLKSNKPALLMSGEFDPVTPPRYGEEVAKGLSNARHVVLKGQGHNVIARGCMPRLLNEFIEKTDPGALDASCLDRLGPTPVFIGFNGATP
jgi:pimeloyl-ACP methyl ester carboxylesterase